MALPMDDLARWRQVGVMLTSMSSHPELESSTSQAGGPWGGYDHYDAAYDNASNLCHDDFYFQCPGDQPIMMITLRWAKILALKVGRSYYGGPICLMMIPLVLGLKVGFIMGSRGHSSVKKRTVPKSSYNFSLYRFLTNVCQWFSAVYIPSFKPLLFSEFQRRHLWFLTEDPELDEKEEHVRLELKSASGDVCESGVDISLIPKHVAVIMDGNRRYGKRHYPDNPTQGHWDGSKTLVSFCKWCIAEKIQILTVYAFSTENWNRSADEVAALMAIFSKYCDELRIEAIQRNIRIHVLSTETNRIPSHVKAGIKRMVDETSHCQGGLQLNICLSYGSRAEIVYACRRLAVDVQKGDMSPEEITEDAFQQYLLSPVDPDLVIRTSGEQRISNFLLWQLAYSELFFLDKTWPEMQKEDLVEVIRAFAGGRDRRFGR